MERDVEKRPAAKKRRGKGTGSLFVRGRFWYARWRRNGEDHAESTGIRADAATKEDREANRKAAEERLMDLTEPLRMRRRENAVAVLMRQLQTAEERLRDAMERTVARPTLGGMADLFAASARRPDCSEDQLGRYLAAIRRFAEFAGPDRPVADIGDADAEAYSRHLVANFSPNTHNKAVNALDLAWRVCGKSAGVVNGANPWAGIVRKRLDTHAKRALTREETDRMLAEAKGELRMLVAVMLYTGLRMGDACRLRWEDVRGGTVFVLTSKRGKKVAVPMHRRLAEIVRGNGGRSAFVMPGMARTYGVNGRGAGVVSKAVKRLMARCGIEANVRKGKGRSRSDASAHSLRHTFVTRAIEAGVPPHVVQAVVGHSSAAMTEHYTHLSEKAVLKAFGKIR